MKPHQILNDLLSISGFALVRSAKRRFHADNYVSHNLRRMEHLASLRIPVAGRSVLEVGAGVGDHSGYFIDRNCRITITDARQDNLKYLRRRYPGADIRFLDMEHPKPLDNAPFDIVYCYGLLYHLNAPETALQFLSQNCAQMLLLETVVSFGSTPEENLVPERKFDASQSFSGTGCRPTRIWIFERLKRLFKYVYIPITQPNHVEFPTDWSGAGHTAAHARAIFIASRESVNNPLLSTELLEQQIRCD